MKSRSLLQEKLVFSWKHVALIAAFSLVVGAFLQRNHAFNPFKRILQGRPFHIAPPTHTILDWEFKQKEFHKPQYILGQLTLKEVEANRFLYVSKLEELLRLQAFPRSHSFKIRILEKIELPKVYREKIEIETEPDLWIPFYLFIPKGGKHPRPLILVFHGHSAGKIETAGIVSSYQKKNARTLAEAGFVTAAPDLRGFGELGWTGDWNDPMGHQYGRSVHIQDVIDNLRMGRTTLGSFIYDARKILDYLSTRPEVDAERIGVAGISMGGDVAIWFAIFDPRVKAIAASSASLLGYPPRSVDYGEYHPCIHTIPRILEFFRLRDIPLLVAPRPFLLDLYRANRDDPFIRQKLEEFYREAGSLEKLSFLLHKEGETFHNGTAIEWFKKWLSNVPKVPSPS